MKDTARIILPVPLAAALAFAIHTWASKKQPIAETHSYTIFLGIVFALGVITAVLQSLSPPLRHWMRDLYPLVAATVFLLGLWGVITSGFRWLPLPYFSCPPGGLQSLFSDR